MAKKTTTIAKVASEKDKKQINTALLSYANREQVSVETGKLVPIITYKSVPPEFDFRNVRFHRDNDNDFEIFAHLGRDIVKIKDADFEKSA